MGISKGHITESAFMGEFDNFQKAVGIPFDMCVATSEDGFRKPSCGLWELLVEKSLKGTEPSLKESFYVGDAGGRPANSGQLDRKKEHSYSDGKFAINVGVDFYTPEKYFLKKPKVQSRLMGLTFTRSKKALRC
ncbi:putative bifunctional polynucleotide phosphatase [Monocercomonoides exilis]|uniref:putative bifunctional polynucleotide phosphatase n=1 Tax=Monocercomonoides exilis TaxID=2049356 RepID=UPI00355A84AE|nr:putative bifunctional polynucleotide phosphatase [Monocercomonoides exilis]|eukprot:MONOS_12813.1-p1 / transcript=MONOS_12813.1 / gene=MONOS_12813 / organism=Monocercomonoides_exilis_PA203 / gene_product=bifunctional polynucleotide phosphatase / transcript_product=bifunctional polynucleotide phosphatase / location=Mono_scaffold00737:10699-11100(-) / protein_length=133 / sequence_SO=supercontig / SO=protein_coding / is_pseudo=false